MCKSEDWECTGSLPCALFRNLVLRKFTKIKLILTFF